MGMITFNHLVFYNVKVVDGYRVFDPLVFRTRWVMDGADFVVFDGFFVYSS
jgi:hypothetical protein